MNRLFAAMTSAAALSACMLAHAQNPNPTVMLAAPDASVGGQASTKTPAGVPNPTQRPQGAMPNNREAVKAEARMDNKSPSNTKTPRGEASTMTNGVPNATPAVGAMTRSEVKPSTRQLNPQMGKVGERPDVPTNPPEKTGTPK
ncbi:hypothetical protein BH11PSE13_BH11PSE13_32370 [soil metagenome]